MEIDTPKRQEEEKIAVHPLAIVNMSDQYTRITCGGSPLAKDDAVVGLLFGMCTTTTTSTTASTTTAATAAAATKQQQPKHPDSNKNASASAVITNTNIQIKDADDIPTDASEAATRQVSLHQAVFPLQSVLGWYRVASSSSSSSDHQGGGGEEPTAQDLLLTQQLHQHYQQEPFVFALLQVSSNSNNNDMQKVSSNNDGGDADYLPLMLYKLVNNDVLVALPHWTLETSDAERIAVERVIREQPQRQQEQQQQAAMTSGNDAAESAAGGTGATTTLSNEQESSSSSHFCMETRSLQHSLQAIQERLQILTRFLQDTQTGTIPMNHALLRQVQSVCLQVGPLNRKQPQQQEQQGSSCDTTTTTTTALVEQVALLSKTVDAVQDYTDKFRAIHDSNSSNITAGGGSSFSGTAMAAARATREVRRGF